MRFATPDNSTPVNYFTYFEATAEERATLLRYLEFLVVDCAYERVANDDRFAPSAAWRWWASGTFVGVSGDRIMVKSGHRFVDSQEVAAYLPAAGAPPSLIGYFRKCLAKVRQLGRYGTLNDNLRAFKSKYSGFRSPPQHDLLLKTHGFVYLRMLEVFNLAEFAEPPRTVVEVGGGACVQAAIMIGAFGCKYAVIDLPETIAVGYSYLKTAFPELRIALPDVVAEAIGAGEPFESVLQRYDMVFLLPYQVDVLPAGSFDVAANISSFQEMDIDVVNEYLALFRRLVRPGGRLVLENLKTSRETAGNAFERYCMDGFVAEKRCDPWYADYVVRSVPGLNHFFYQGQRDRHGQG